MVILTVTGVCSPSWMSTFSIASAETEWMSIFPAWNGIRALPSSMSSASAILTTPASMVRGFLGSSCAVMQCKTSEVMIVRSSSEYTDCRNFSRKL